MGSRLHSWPQGSPTAQCTQQMALSLASTTSYYNPSYHMFSMGKLTLMTDEWIGRGHIKGRRGKRRFKGEKKKEERWCKRPEEEAEEVGKQVEGNDDKGEEEMANK